MFNKRDKITLQNMKNRIGNIEFLLDKICKILTVSNNQNPSRQKNMLWLGKENIPRYAELKAAHPEITAIVVELLKMYSGIDFSAIEDNPNNGGNNSDGRN